MIRFAANLCRFVLAIPFLAAGLLKIGHQPELARSIHNFFLLPSQWIGLTAIILPWLELVCATTLVFGVWIESSALILGVLSLFFAVATASVLWRGFDVECGCFNGTGHTSMAHVFFNLALLAFAVVVVAFHHRKGNGQTRSNSEPS